MSYNPDPNAGQTLMVNLFLLLLAFFIVLVALSEIVDERSDQALSSIAKVFSVITDATENTNNNPEKRSSGISDDFVLTLVSRLSNSTIRVLDPKIIQKGSNKVFVRYDLIDLFPDNSSNIRADKITFIRRIADSINKANNAIHVTVSITSPIEDFRNDFDTAGVPLAAKRVDQIVDIMINEGVPDYYIQGNVNNDLEEKFVEFVFYMQELSFPNIKFIPKGYIEQ